MANLRFDVNYYKAQQIMPCLERLCLVLDPNCQTPFAIALGLDSSKYARQNPLQAQDHFDLEEDLEDDKLDKSVQLTLQCLECSHVWPLATLVTPLPHLCNLLCP